MGTAIFFHAAAGSFLFIKSPKLPNKVPLPFTKGGGRCAILIPEFPVKSIHTERSFVSMSQAAAQQPSR